MTKKGAYKIMQNVYMSTYISGFSKVIEKILKQKIPDVIIVNNMDGAIIYKTNTNIKNIDMPFFNNSFFVLAYDQCNCKLDFNKSIQNLIFKHNFPLGVTKNFINPKKDKTFKILGIDKNQPTALDYKLVMNVEKKIHNSCKLSVAFRKHDLDFLFIRRTEGIILFLLKLTYNRITERKLNRGELRPELAYILSWLTEIQKSDVIMDPFCGYGAIPKAIVKNFSYNMLFASDLDKNLTDKLKLEYKNNKKNFYIKQRDALNLSYFENNFIDKIVTDPPWNIFNTNNNINYQIFYEKVLNEFYRILKPHGICVVLMGNIKDFECALNKVSFICDDKYCILVNGKKANVYKLIKT